MRDILTRTTAVAIWFIVAIVFLILSPFIWLFFRKQLRKADEEINNLFNSC